MIKKILSPTFESIEVLETSRTLKLDVEHYLLNGYDVYIQKIENGISASIHFKPFKGFNSSQLHTIELPQPIVLKNDSVKYYLPENSILLNQTFSDVNGDELMIEISGSITQISTASTDAVFDNNFLRLVIPIKEREPKLREIRGWSYQMDLGPINKTLINVLINGKNYHFFHFATSGKHYLVVDTITPFQIGPFKRLSHSILLAFGFLYGDLFLDEGYILSSKNEDFTVIEEIQFSTYRESLFTGYRIHTTNAFSVIDLTRRTKKEREQRLLEAKSWINDIVEIEPDTFSNLCQLFFNSEPISRAAIVTLQGNVSALEVKGSAYSIALEALTGVIMAEKREKNPKPLSKEIFKELRDRFLLVLDEIVPDTPDNKIAREIFTARIQNLNSPSNTSKLQRAFSLVGYELTSYELDALNARNKFQHGLLPVSDHSEDVASAEIYHVCIIMHRLISILVLKYIGYNGFIINYPQIHKNITKKDLNEREFYRI